MRWSQPKQEQNIPKAKLSAKALKQGEAALGGKSRQDAVAEATGRGELDRKVAGRLFEALQAT